MLHLSVLLQPLLVLILYFCFTFPNPRNEFITLFFFFFSLKYSCYINLICLITLIVISFVIALYFYILDSSIPTYSGWDTDKRVNPSHKETFIECKGPGSSGWYNCINNLKSKENRCGMQLLNIYLLSQMVNIFV